MGRTATDNLGRCAGGICSSGEHFTQVEHARGGDFLGGSFPPWHSKQYANVACPGRWQ